jgi:hypothetical protein
VFSTSNYKEEKENKILLQISVQKNKDKSYTVWSGKFSSKETNSLSFQL